MQLGESPDQGRGNEGRAESPLDSDTDPIAHHSIERPADNIQGEDIDKAQRIINRSLPATVRVQAEQQPIVGFCESIYEPEEGDPVPLLVISVPHSDVATLLLELTEALGDEVDIVIGSGHQAPKTSHEEMIRQDVDAVLLRTVLDPFVTLIEEDGCFSVAVMNEDSLEVQLTGTKEIYCYGDAVSTFREILALWNIPEVEAVPLLECKSAEFEVREAYKNLYQELTAGVWGSPFGATRLTVPAGLKDLLLNSDARFYEGFKRYAVNDEGIGNISIAVSEELLYPAYIEMLRELPDSVNMVIDAEGGTCHVTSFRSYGLSREEVIDRIAESWSFIANDAAFEISIFVTGETTGLHEVRLCRLNTIMLFADSETLDHYQEMLENRDFAMLDDSPLPEDIAAGEHSRDVLVKEPYYSFAARYMELLPEPLDAVQRMENRMLYCAEVAGSTGGYVINWFAGLPGRLKNLFAKFQAR